MTMDYGDITDQGFKKEDGNVMGRASLFAVCNTVLQMQTISQDIYGSEKGNYTDEQKRDWWLMDGTDGNSGVINKWEDSYYSKIGNTPMAGLNDNVTEQFNIKSAQVLQNFVDNSKSYKIETKSNDHQTSLLNDILIWKSGSSKTFKLPTYTSVQPSSSLTGTPTYLNDYLNEHTGGFTNGSGHIGMWSFQRDTPCERNEGGSYVSTSCSSAKPAQEKPMEYSSIFQSTQNTINDSIN